MKHGNWHVDANNNLRKWHKLIMCQGGVDVGRRQVLDTKYAFNVSVLQRSAF
jgi:hypothetical protein